MLSKKYSLRDIAKVLNRSVSTISDEIKRNSVNKEYNSKKANHKAIVRRNNSKFQGKKIVKDKSLKKFVDNNLIEGCSPESISGRVSLENLPKVSKDSIYRYIKSVHGRKIEALRNKEKIKRKQKKRKSIKKLDDRVFIDKRPRIINDRSRIGDIEADFVVSGKSGSGILLVVVDRKTRYTLIARINKVSIKQVHRSFSFIKKRFPELKSITLDNDILFSKHKHLEKLLKVPIYFCNPYHSWEKGTVENVNKHIRKYIPKGSDISKYSRKDVNLIEKKLNSRYLKCLEFKTPQEVLDEFRQKKNT